MTLRCQFFGESVADGLHANALSFNPLTHSGLVHPYPLLGVNVVLFSFFITFRMKIPVANIVDADQTPRFAASNLRLHCWQRSQRWVTRDKRLI